MGIDAVRREVAEVLRRLGATVAHGSGGRLRVSIAGGPKTDVSPVERSVLSSGRAADAVKAFTAKPSPGIAMVVADKIPAPAREVLNQSNTAWYDRRGHVRIVAPGVLIDSDVPPAVASDQQSLFPAGRTGVGVAVTLLSIRAAAAPDAEWTPIAPTVTDIARHSGVAVSGVSTTLKTFRRLGYLHQNGSPVIPDLFWATVEQWRPRWIGLASPIDSNPKLLTTLNANIDEPSAWGWCLGGDPAAAAWQAPIVGGDTAGGWWYMPDRDTFDTVRWTLGETGPGQRATAHIAVAPTPAICALRVFKKRVGPVEPLVVAALDLALDQARGRETLEAWTPTEGTRVW